MKSKLSVILLVGAVIMSWAGNSMSFPQRKRAEAAKDKVAKDDSINGRLLKPDDAATDTTQMDSLQLAIYHHNKAIDDSIKLDSINRSKKNGIDAPVNYTAQDSLVYDARTRTARLYGSSEVKYESMDLQSDKINMSLDSSLVHATGTADSTEKGGLRGRPVLKMGSDTYDTDTIAFNFKTDRKSVV